MIVRDCQQCGAPVREGDRYCAACGATLISGERSGAQDPLIGRVVGGSYVLQEIVAVGGMGRVYRAEQSTLGRTVAVKVIHPHLLDDEQTVARFYQEARASSRLNHPNSVSVIDFGRTDDGILYLVMEYLSGKDLALVMHEEGPLPFGRICRVLISTLDALGEAHEFGIVHRDLKPENIIVRPMRSGQDLVKVVDFGLATILGGDTSITRPGLVCGTPDYMSPEQGRGEDVDGRGDLYALGVLLFELLTGQLPFIDDTPTKVVLRHLNDPVPDPRDTVPARGIPDVLADLTMRALTKSREKRFQNAREMQDALRGVLEAIRAEEEGAIVCPNCSAQNSARSKFCGECGTRLLSSEAVQAFRSSFRPSFFPPLGSQRPFVGREQEMARIERIQEESRGGSLWVHVRGEAGVGKTRFLAEVAESVATGGALVVGAGLHPTGALVPYHPIARILAELLQTPLEEMHRFGSESSGFGDALARAGIREVLAPSSLVGSEGQSRSGAVAAALAQAIMDGQARVQARSVCIVVDDLVDCDGLSQRVVNELTRALGKEPVLVLTAGADDRSGQANETILLDGLNLEGARMFVSAAGRLDAAGALDELVPLVGGGFLPLYLEQLEALGAGARDEPLPTKLADALAQRTERLSVEAFRLLQVASVLGTSVSLGLLRQVSADTDLNGMDELARNALVQVKEGRMDIVHPFIRDVIEASIPAEARRELHRIALGAVSEREGPLEVRAEHAFRGADPLASLVVLERAGDQAMSRGDGLSAVLFYRRALDLSRREMFQRGETVMGSGLATFSRKLGEALSRAGDPAGADGVLREAIDFTPPRSAERGRMLLALGSVALRRDRPRDAMREFGRALEIVAGVAPKVESHLQVAIGRIRRSGGDAPHAANAYRRALELFEELEIGPDVTARVRLELADALITIGDAEAATRQLERVRDDGHEMDALELVARAIGTMGSLDELQGRRDRALRRYEEAAELAAQAGDAPGHRRWRSASKGLAA